MLIVRLVMLITRMKVMSISPFHINGLDLLHAAMETDDISRVKVQRGVGWVGRWVGRGADGRQTCGAEVLIVALMVFQEGDGLT